MIAVFIVLSSCKEESDFVLQEEAITSNNDNQLKGLENPPYYEVESWKFINGKIDCAPPATNCSIVIVRPKQAKPVIDFIANNKDGDFYKNSIAVSQNLEMLSMFIKNDVLVKIVKGELFVKFLLDERASYFLVLNEMKDDYTTPNVYSVWKFNN